MKHIIKKETGITMVALIVTVIMLLILTNVLIYNANDSIYIKVLTNLYNDIDLLREKVSEYYNEYGEIPAEIKYTNVNQLYSVLSKENDIGDFYVIDLEVMQGITLNYGKEYEKIKNDKQNADNYKDVYIINENSHNIFYVQGVSIKENNTEKTYYTDYTEPDETTIDLRYIDGILIPDGYYYIGKEKDDNGIDENIVISSNKNDKIDKTTENQYKWMKQISILDKIPTSIILESQNEEEFIKSVNNYKGYFKNKNGNVVYIPIKEDDWSETYKEETEYKDEYGDIAYIPQGFKVSMSPIMNKISKGLVAKDEKENEWVWIEVPKTVFKTANVANEQNKLEAIKTDLIEYAKDYREGKKNQGYDWKDEYYEGCGIESAEKYTEMYHKMLSSVYTNGGFWISRYEIGDSTNTESNTIRTEENCGKTGEAVSKADQMPYNWVTCSEAQELANTMLLDTSKTSSLLFGVQWDLVCKFLEEKTDLTQEDIKTDSVNWGNYKNSSLKLNRGKYNTSPHSLSSIWTRFDVDTENVTSCKTSSNTSYYQLLTTGASEQTRKANIYNFAGNVRQWTLEKTSSSSSPCACRSGFYNDNGYFAPASCRFSNAISYKIYRIGFRVAIY